MAWAAAASSGTGGAGGAATGNLAFNDTQNADQSASVAVNDSVTGGNGGGGSSTGGNGGNAAATVATTGTGAVTVNRERNSAGTGGSGTIDFRRKRDGHRSGDRQHLRGFKSGLSTRQPAMAVPERFRPRANSTEPAGNLLTAASATASGVVSGQSSAAAFSSIGGASQGVADQHRCASATVTR